MVINKENNEITLWNSIYLDSTTIPLHKLHGFYSPFRRQNCTTQD